MSDKQASKPTISDLLDRHADFAANPHPYRLPDPRGEIEARFRTLTAQRDTLDSRAAALAEEVNHLTAQLGAAQEALRIVQIRAGWMTRWRPAANHFERWCVLCEAWESEGHSPRCGFALSPARVAWVEAAVRVAEAVSAWEKRGSPSEEYPAYEVATWEAAKRAVEEER